MNRDEMIDLLAEHARAGLIQYDCRCGHVLRGWVDAGSPDRERREHAAHVAAAVLPLIEADLRERLAGEIEAANDRAKAAKAQARATQISADELAETVGLLEANLRESIAAEIEALSLAPTKLEIYRTVLSIVRGATADTDPAPDNNCECHDFGHPPNNCQTHNIRHCTICT